MYDYNSLRRDVNRLRNSGVEVRTIGYTLLGREIPALFKGDATQGKILLQAAMHAREWVTSPLAIRMFESYTGTARLCVVPMVNIDGVLLAEYGLSSIPDRNLRSFLLNVNGGNENFSEWKANARAVDLNVNYNALWGTGALNVTYPSSGNYIGAHPFSEPENKALRELTETYYPNITLSYHAKGEVIYNGFSFVNSYPEQAQRLADSIGYPMFRAENSAGGYKDWFLATTQRLGLTVEVGNLNIPYPELYNNIDEIYAQNANVLNVASEMALEIT